MKSIPRTVLVAGRDPVFAWRDPVFIDVLVSNVCLIAILLVLLVGSAPVLAGELTGASSDAPANVDLSAQGSADWLHWGRSGASNVNRKVGVAALISDFTPVGGYTPSANQRLDTTYTWSDGEPVASASTRAGLRAFNIDRGFSLSIAAGTNLSSTTIYVGAGQATGRFTAALSDGSAVPFSVDLQQGAGRASFAVTLTYMADSAGQTLDIEYIVIAKTATAGSFVSLEAAVLEGELPDQAPIIEPIADQFVIEGSALSLPVTATDVDGPGPLLLEQTNTLPGGPEILTVLSEGVGQIDYIPDSLEAGSYSVTLTATAGNGVSTSETFNVSVIPPGSQAQLTVNSESDIGAIDLTLEGSRDWVHWGRGGIDVVNRKANVAPLISDYTLLNSGAVNVQDPVSANYTWSDGTPLTSAFSRSAVRTSQVGQGFALSVPADVLTRTLMLYLSTKNGGGKLTLSVSGVAEPAQELILTRSAGKRSHAVTVIFSAPTAGQTLDVVWEVDSLSTFGWISLDAAAVTGPPANSAPVLTTPAPQSVIEGQLLNFSVSATDNDGPTPLTLSATSNLPGNPDIYTDIAAGAGEVNWMPALGDAEGSPYNISVTAVDGGGRSSSAGVNVTVVPDSSGPNTPPVFSDIATQAAVETFALLVSVAATDNGGPLPLVLSQASTVPDPENVVLTDNGDGTGQIIWTPPVDSTGTYSFTVDAFDGELTTTTSFDVVVSPPGAGGLLVGSPAIAAAEVDLTELGETDWVHWGLGGVNTAVNRKAGVIPQIGNFIELGGAEPSATNNGMVARYLWSDGDPNTNGNTRSGLRAFDEGRGFAFSVPASVDSRRLKLFVGANTVTARLTAILSDSSAPPYVFDVVQPVGKASREITLDFAAPTPGATLDITYIVVDRPVSGWASLESAALVAGNARPVIAELDDVVVRPDVPMLLQVNVSDPDGDLTNLQVSVASDVPTAATFINEGDGVWLWEWTPQASALGDFSVTFTAVDEFSAVTQLTVGITVTLSDPPQLAAVGVQQIVEGQTLFVSLAASDIDGPAPLEITQQNDLPGDAALLVDTGDGTASFSWLSQVGDAAAGPYSVVATVTDGGGTASEIMFPVVVVENAVPLLQLSPSGSTMLNEGQTLAVMVVATDPDATGALSVTQTNTLPGNPVSFAEVAPDTWELLWTAGVGDASALPSVVTVTAIDGLGGQTEQQLEITIQPNQAPIIDTVGPLVLRADQLFELDLQITDPDGPLPLVIAESNTFPGSPTTVSSAGVFSWTPSTADILASPFSLTVTATDGLLGVTTATYVVEVTDNLQPTLDVSGVTTLEEWQTLALVATAADADGQIVSVAATTTLPDGVIVVDNNDGTYGVTATISTGASASAQTITIVATDDAGGVTTEEIPLSLSPRSRPNIVLILTDDQGVGDVAYSGFASDLQTPALDDLATEGMRFNNFYANSSVCSPTRASLLTGRYPAKVGVPGTVARDPETNMGQFTPNGATLPELLQTAGYATALVGKWHLGDKVVDVSNVPNARGFDEFRGFLGSALDYYTHDGSKFAWPGDDLIMINNTVVPPAEHVGIHTTDLLTPWAVDYIDEQTTNQTQPFFLEVAYTAPHDPVQPPPEFLAAVKSREPGLSDERANLVALLEHMDASIGAIVQKLKDTGVYDNTLIIYSSDNGGYTRFAANNGPYRGGKLNMYEGGIRVPAVVSWPGRVAPGSQTDEVAVTMDLMPTIAEIVDVAIPQEIDGRSIVPTLRAQAPVYPSRDIVFENRSTLKESRWKMIYALRRDDWKLVQDVPGGSFELYNLNADPFETNNLAASEPLIFAELRAALDAHIAQTDLVPWQRELVFEEGTVTAVNEVWQSVPLSQAYRNPIIVATPIYTALQPPVVTRIRGVTIPGQQSVAFDLRVQRADGTADAVGPVAVNYMVFEAGIYNEAHHGIKMEALPLSTRNRTNSSGFWGAQTQPIANSYISPVVVGQVISNVDDDFSVFWARGGTRQLPPSTTKFRPAKHVGEDPDRARGDETVGYVIFESGRSNLSGKTLRAAVGPRDVRGMDDAPPYFYDIGDQVIPENVVLSTAGMADTNGGWPVLVGPDPLAGGQLALATDEDTITDAERAHSPERVAHVLFGNSRPAIAGLPASVTVVIGDSLSLPFTYADLDDPLGVTLTLASDAPLTDRPVLTDTGVLPPGAPGAEGAASIDWLPQTGSAGVHTLTLSAADGRGGDRVVTVEVTVTEP